MRLKAGAAEISTISPYRIKVIRFMAIQLRTTRRETPKRVYCITVSRGDERSTALAVRFLERGGVKSKLA